MTRPARRDRRQPAARRRPRQAAHRGHHPLPLPLRRTGVRAWAIGHDHVPSSDGWKDERGAAGRRATTRSARSPSPARPASRQPAAGAGLDINLLNQRNWIDVTLPSATGCARQGLGRGRRARDRALRARHRHGRARRRPARDRARRDHGHRARVPHRRVRGRRRDVSYLTGAWSSTAADDGLPRPRTLSPSNATRRRRRRAAGRPGVLALDEASVEDLAAEITLSGAGPRHRAAWTPRRALRRCSTPPPAACASS